MTEALIAGGGLAGAGLAISLAQAGREVLLIEKETGPHDKVCGEFLSGEAARYLTHYGLNLAALGAVPVTHVRLAQHRIIAEAALPFPAWSLSRRVLDEALLAKAVEAGASVRRGLTVKSLTRDSLWQARLDGDEVIMAETAFVATGKHDLRGWKRPAGTRHDLVGFKMHWRLTASETAALGQAVELILFPGGYGGLERVEHGMANLCLLVKRSQLEKCGGQWGTLLKTIRSAAPHLERRLAGATPLWDRPLAITAIPYGFVRQHDDSGAWWLGDQSAVIPSFSGEGMSIALHSARLAAMTYLAGKDAAAFHRRLSHDVGPQVRLATWLSQALVNNTGQATVRLAASWIPGLLARAGQATRLPDAALAA